MCGISPQFDYGFLEGGQVKNCPIKGY